MTITAKIIEDSISKYGDRLTTFQLRYPRFIHGEFLTHRVFSRNASSSRAIPVKKIIEDILNDTAMPIHWGKNRPGMQAKENHNEIVDFGFMKVSKEEAWLHARDKAIEVARAFEKSGYHKQIVNRILEPFSHISVVVSSTNFSNFFGLRSHEDAQPEIKVLSDLMKNLYEENIPNKLSSGEWHLPYVLPEEKTLPIEIQRKISVARCARVSYLKHDGTKPEIEKDIKLHDDLVISKPLHASPAEHQATPDGFDFVFNVWNNQELHGNFTGFIQYRKTLPNEFIEQ